MATVTGKIKQKETENKGEFVKNVLTIKPNKNELVFIEFRGVMKQVSDHYKIGECVIVEYCHQGNVSKSGSRFNNLVATSIERVNPKTK